MFQWFVEYTTNCCPIEELSIVNFQFSNQTCAKTSDSPSTYMVQEGTTEEG